MEKVQFCFYTNIKAAPPATYNISRLLKALTE